MAYRTRRYGNTSGRKVYDADYLCKFEHRNTDEFGDSTSIRCGSKSQAAVEHDLHVGQTMETAIYGHQFCASCEAKRQGMQEAGRANKAESYESSQRNWRRNFKLLLEAQAAGTEAVSSLLDDDGPTARHGVVFMSLSDKRSSLATHYRKELGSKLREKGKQAPKIDVGALSVIVLSITDDDCGIEDSPPIENCLLAEAGNRQISTYLSAYMGVLQQAGVGCLGGEQMAVIPIAPR